MSFAVIMLALLAGQCAPCVHYTPHVVDLRGRLIATVRYGPPNYGENPNSDERVRVWLLRLSKPLDMCSDQNGDRISGVREVQVFFQHDASKFRGKLVRVRGSLEEATLGPEFTKVVMYARSIESDP